MLQVTITVDTMLCIKPTDGPGPVNDRDEVYFVVKCTGPGKADAARRLPANDDYYEFKKGTHGEKTGWTNQNQMKQGNPILWAGNLANGEICQVLVVVGEQDNKDLPKIARTVAAVGAVATPIVGDFFGAGAAGKKIGEYLDKIQKLIKDNPDDVIGSFSVSVKNDNNKLVVEYVAGDKTKMGKDGSFQARGDGSYDGTVKATSALVKAGTPVPKRRVYLGEEVDRCSETVLKVKETGGMVEVRKGESKEVYIADPRITWFCGSSEEKATLRPSTNLVVVEREKDGRKITWKCYREE